MAAKFPEDDLSEEFGVVETHSEEGPDNLEAIQGVAGSLSQPGSGNIKYR